MVNASMQKWLIAISLVLAAGFLWLILPVVGHAGSPAQIPTGSIPTVTGTPVGALAVILDNEQGFINVRAGPSTMVYEIVGMITAGSSVPAIGRTPGGDWVEVVYPGGPGGVGWIWSELVDVRGPVPIVEPPPTPTPATTATIDPTLAAQFLVEIPATRLPTYTPPGEIVQPTLPADAPIASNPGRVPMALIIIGMAVIGVFGVMISIMRRR